MSRLATFRESDLKRAIKSFRDLGLPVAGATISRAGEITVLTSAPTLAPVEEDAYEKWKSKRGDRAA